MRAPLRPASLAALVGAVCAASCSTARSADADSSAVAVATPATTPAQPVTAADSARADSALAAYEAQQAASSSPAAKPATATPAPRPAQPGDLTIHSMAPHAGMVLSLAGDSISMGLSDSVLAVIRKATDSVPDKIKAETKGGLGDAFGAMIARTVTSAVNGAMKMRVAYALTDITDARYEDGTIRFDYRPGAKHTISFEDVKVGDDKDKNRPALASFAPADAQRFVAAVRARSGGRMTFPPKAAKP